MKVTAGRVVWWREGGTSSASSTQNRLPSPPPNPAKKAQVASVGVQQRREPGRAAHFPLASTVEK